jgi:hypothetical protein
MYDRYHCHPIVELPSLTKSVRDLSYTHTYVTTDSISIHCPVSRSVDPLLPRKSIYTTKCHLTADSSGETVVLADTPIPTSQQFLLILNFQVNHRGDAIVSFIDCFRDQHWSELSLGNGHKILYANSQVDHRAVTVLSPAYIIRHVGPTYGLSFDVGMRENSKALMWT